MFDSLITFVENILLKPITMCNNRYFVIKIITKHSLASSDCANSYEQTLIVGVGLVFKSYQLSRYHAGKRCLLFH